MPGFREVFEAYGADYEVTMGRFLGNESLYLKLLGMLSRDDNLLKLGDSLDSGDLTGAFEAAHTLKGVAGNLGLAPLSAAVTAIVEPLRMRQEREDYPALFEAVEREFKEAEQFAVKLKKEVQP